METGIREYAEGLGVEIKTMEINGEKRLVILARNEGGYNCTEVDFYDVINFYKENYV
jgi:hypothetical protein